MSLHSEFSEIRTVKIPYISAVFRIGASFAFITNATHWDIRQMLRTQAKPNNMNTSKTQLHLYKN